jgi:tetratricopeptide (TPR) repeat protein
MSYRSTLPRTAVLAATLGLAISSPAFAFGGGHSGGSGTGTRIPACQHGFVYSKAKHACVQTTSHLLNDSELYADGHDLALAGRYQEALDALGAVRDKDSMTLTMIGYATRKSGDYDRGVAYYMQALALDANNVNTHEYLGEAYAEKGRIDDAKLELVKVASLAGSDSEQYRDLAAAIAGLPDEG